jgi:uncharacterized protein (TIGR02453 family)
MSTTHISKATLKFLKDIKANNNRDWFNENKPRYQDAQAEVKAFNKSLHDRMSLHDEIERVKLFRIYRDVRFSKNKTPFKTNFGTGITRATKWKRGGYYFNIEPGNCFAGGGFWGPNPADLKRIREEIAADDKALREVINGAQFKKVFGSLKGDQVKTAPKGFSKEHSAIDLLRHKQFLATHSFTEKAITTPGFVDELDNVLRALRPFFDYMSEVLTTDSNGVPIE